MREREGEMAARASNEANEQEPTNSAILLAWAQLVLGWRGVLLTGSSIDRFGSHGSDVRVLLGF